jgi:hypothetical protein
MLLPFLLQLLQGPRVAIVDEASQLLEHDALVALAKQLVPVQSHLSNKAAAN